MPLPLTLAFLLLRPTTPSPIQPATLDGVTFASSGSSIYVPVREIGKAFGWPVSYRSGSNTVWLGNGQLKNLKTLPDGTTLVLLSELRNHGATVAWDGKEKLSTVRSKADSNSLVNVRVGQKRVFVNMTERKLVAWQGERVIMRSTVSLGREGHETPRGNFKAQGYKTPMHYSSLYNNTPMPWSVQIVGNIFIHGSNEVGRSSRSHGCIRLPLAGKNPARWFYYWIEKGTPVAVTNKWPAGAQ